MGMSDTERTIRKRLRNDFVHYAEKCLKIRTKSGKIINLCLNKAQIHIHQIVENQILSTGKVRVIIVKGRQEGCSTYVEGRFYWKVTHNFGLRAFILTHHTNATNNLFEMAKRYHDNCPLVVRPSIQASNAKELIFSGLDSGYKIGTAGNKSVGRSETIQLLHGSEVAYWPNANELAKGIMQAVPNNENTEIFLESTANGVGNYFHQQWQAAKDKQSEFIPIFIPWYWENGYRLSLPNNFDVTEEENNLMELYGLDFNQIMWRRVKIIELSEEGKDGEKSFKQEYPMNDVEAFQLSGDSHFIPPDVVMTARKTKVEAYGKLLIGVDPARFGKDRTSIIRRRTRKAYGLENYVHTDGMEVVGIIHNIILSEKPYKVFIDVIGMGGPMYDRLIELGHKNVVVPVNSSHKALNEKRYFNKRAEMWGTMREWLLDTPCEIPDEDVLHADLCGPVAKPPDSNGRLKLESKDDMLARKVRSPDTADALSFTFALPDTALADDQNETYKNIAKEMMSTVNTISMLKKKAYS